MFAHNINYLTYISQLAGRIRPGMCGWLLSPDRYARRMDAYPCWGHDRKSPGMNEKMWLHPGWSQTWFNWSIVLWTDSGHSIGGTHCKNIQTLLIMHNSTAYWTDFWWCHTCLVQNKYVYAVLEAWNVCQRTLWIRSALKPASCWRHLCKNPWSPACTFVLGNLWPGT